MKWTQELPSETGYYWFYQSNNQCQPEPRIVYIFWQDDSSCGFLQEIGGDKKIYFLHTYGLLGSGIGEKSRWWCGPIGYPNLVYKNVEDNK